MKTRNVYHDFFLFHGVEGKPRTRDDLPVGSSSQIRKEADEILIKERLSVFEKYLDQLNFDKNRPAIIVGSEDFFETPFNDRFLDLETVYSMLMNEFAAISKKYPHIIFTPGSLYVSVPAPSQHFDIRFEQDGQRQKMKNEGCYFSNIMPVFYNGELQRIIRKGELVYLIKQVNNKTERNELESIDDLNDSILMGKPKLHVLTYHEDEADTMLKSGNETISACYVGKTLLPAERELISKYCGSSIDLKKFFSHEMVVNDQSFCFVICGEFNGASLPNWFGTETTVGALLLNNDYDYIIHSTHGGDIPSDMLKQTGFYLHSDNSNVKTSPENKVKVSGNSLQLPVDTITDEDQNLQVCRYRYN